MMDKAIKNCLLACWRLRECVLGVVQVSHGRLSVVPAKVPYRTRLASQLDCSPRDGVRVHRRHWESWLPAREPNPVKSRSKGRSAFYYVKEGRTPGLFASWKDCERSVKGVDGAVFRGYASLEEVSAAEKD